MFFACRNPVIEPHETSVFMILMESFLFSRSISRSSRPAIPFLRYCGFTAICATSPDAGSKTQ